MVMASPRGNEMSHTLPTFPRAYMRAHCSARFTDASGERFRVGFAPVLRGFGVRRRREKAWRVSTLREAPGGPAQNRLKTVKPVGPVQVLSFDSTSPNSAHFSPSNLASRTDWMG